MLDQNTDRMWYVIGAVIIGAAIILIMNKTFPQLFASVSTTFSDKTEEMTTVVKDIPLVPKFDESFVAYGKTTQSAIPSVDEPAVFQHTSEILVDSTSIRLDTPLRSVGSVSDRFYFDTEDSLWKIERKVKEITYTTSQSMSSNGTVYFARVSDKAYTSPYLTSHFVGTGDTPWESVTPNSNTLIETVQGDLRYAILVGIYPDKSMFPTVESFNQWIVDQSAKGTPLTVLYELDTPTIEVLSADMQKKLASHLNDK